MNDQCPLSDEQIDRIGAQLPGAASWIDFGRAIATAAVEADRGKRFLKERAQLEAEWSGLQNLKRATIPEDRAALAPLGAQAVPISILELMDEVRGLAAQWAGDEVDLACAPSEDASARAQNSHDIFNAAVARLASMSTGTTSPAQIAEDRAALAEECKQIAHHLFDISPDCGKSVLQGLYHKHECP